MAAVDRRKETVNRKAEDAREFVELLEQMTGADKERIKYVMIGLKMGETVRTGLTAQDVPDRNVGEYIEKEKK